MTEPPHVPDDSPTSHFEPVDDYGYPPDEGGYRRDGGEADPLNMPAPPAPHRGRNRVLIGAALIALFVLVAGGTALAMSSGHSGHTSSSSSLTPSSAGPAPSASASSAHTSAKNGQHATVRATIVSVSGSRWTVKTKDGRTASFTLGSSTVLGTKKAPVPASKFTAGTEVVITGSIDNGTVTATRIALPKAPTNKATPGPSPS